MEDRLGLYLEADLRSNSACITQNIQNEGYE